MKLTFSTTLIVNDSFTKHRSLWQASEAYLNFGQKSYKINQIQNTTVNLILSDKKSSVLKIALKVSVCFTIALPLTVAMFLIRAAYRKNYQFNVLSVKKQEQAPQNNLIETKVNEVQSGPAPITKSNNDAVIARIIKAKEEGLKVAIFMGRDNSQVMPKEEGWEWFSLDVMTEEGDTDHHLQMNFNQPADITRIQGLFNKVISDFSTIKFYNNPWPTLHSLLESNEDSELITEGHSGCVGILNIDQPAFYPRKLTLNKPMKDSTKHDQEEKKAFNQWKERVGEAIVSDNFKEFCQGPIYKNITSNEPDNQQLIDAEFIRYILNKNQIEPVPPPTYDNELYEKIEGLLKLLFFNEVEKCSGSYPYRNDVQENERVFWRMRSPKLLVTNWRQMARYNGYD